MSIVVNRILENRSILKLMTDEIKNFVRITLIPPKILLCDPLNGWRQIESEWSKWRKCPELNACISKATSVTFFDCSNLWTFFVELLAPMLIKLKEFKLKKSIGATKLYIKSKQFAHDHSISIQDILYLKSREKPLTCMWWTHGVAAYLHSMTLQVLSTLPLKIQCLYSGKKETI